MSLPYHNRTDAGEILADHLRDYAGRTDTIVLALPRGGVPVAAVVADKIGAGLDLILVRKLGLPGYEEFAMGAIASGGVQVMNDDMLVRHQVPEEAIDRVVARESAELQRREQAYRGDRPPPDLGDRCVMLVDDGLATGSTMRAAIQVVRTQAPREVVLAVPVAPPTTVEKLRREVDKVICPATPESFMAIGRWYRDFTQTSDETVRELLARAWAREKS